MQPLDESTGMCGIEEATRRQLKSRYIELSKRGLLWNMDYLSTEYKEVKPLSHDPSEEDSRHHMAKTHTSPTPMFKSVFSSQNQHHLDAIEASLSAWKITASRRNCSAANCLKEARKLFKDTLRVSMKSFGVTPNYLEYLRWSCQTWSESLWSKKGRSNWTTQET